MFVYTGLESTDSAKAKKIKTDELTVEDEVKKARRRKQSKRRREGKRGSLRALGPAPALSLCFPLCSTTEKENICAVYVLRAFGAPPPCTG